MTTSSALGRSSVYNRLYRPHDTEAVRAHNQFTAPAWISTFDPTVFQAFHSDPTLEPTLVSGNVDLLRTALADAGITAPENITAQTIDDLFRDTAKGKKGEFAFSFADAVRTALEADQPVEVPPAVNDAFDFLFEVPSLEDPSAGPDAAEG
mgnify:CR=1 FL=1